jgi:large subunit ribosomal protein L15
MSSLARLVSLVNRRHPSRNTKEYAAVNIDRLQHWVDQGRLVSTPEQPITARELLLSGCVHDVKDGIKILGDVCVPLVSVNSVG